MKHILYLFLVIITLSCKGQPSTHREAALETFAKQEHRFEVRECGFYYNNEKIELYKPKQYYLEKWGGAFDEDGGHSILPIFVGLEIKSRQESDILFVNSMSVQFYLPEYEEEYEDDLKYQNFEYYEDYEAAKNNKYNEEEEILTYLAKNEYILINGEPFGRDIPISVLNDRLYRKGSISFSDRFAGTPSIRMMAYLHCENSHNYFINLEDDMSLLSFSFEMKKPKNIDAWLKRK